MKSLSTSAGARGLRSLLASLALACSLGVGAQDLQTLRLSGFGTVGLSSVDAPAGWGFRRDITQQNSDRAFQAGVDTRLGLQANYAPDEHFELVGQWIGRKRAPFSSPGDAIEWAFAAWRPDGNTDFRAGRINVQAFLMSDHRNVGFAYPYVRPPVEFYGWLPSTLDGADASRTWHLGDARWVLQGFLGNGRVGDLALAKPVHLGPVFGLTLSRESDGLLWHSTLGTGRFKSSDPNLMLLTQGLAALQALPVPAVAAQAAELAGVVDYSRARVNYLTLGVRREWQDWAAVAEGSIVNVGAYHRDRAGYLALSHRWGDFMVYGVASRVRPVAAPTSSPAWAAALAPVLGAPGAAQAQALADAAVAIDSLGRSDQSTRSVGARWDLLPQLALKLQFDSTHVHGHGGQMWTGATTAPAHIQVSTLTLDFIF